MNNDKVTPRQPHQGKRSHCFCLCGENNYLHPMFSSDNLLWVKNVKRDDGNAWAYSEFKVGDEFYLNWSAKKKGNVLTAGINELILIFQTVNAPKGTFLTHIVSPVSDEVMEDRSVKHPFLRKVCVIAMADPISSIPKPKNLDFYRPNRGAVCKIETIKDFKTKSDFKKKDLQNYIFKLFTNFDLGLDNRIAFISSDSIDEDEVEEGKKNEVLRMHKYYERNPAIVKEAKRRAIEEGRLVCEACKFSFETTYDPLGIGFIECHHKNPIGSGGVRKTRVEDLAIVCSNCHRMLHRKWNGQYLTIEELKNRFFPESHYVK